MTNRISNAEFTLLQILAQFDEISGYEINKLVDERGYREWADIGTTSIYVGLDKLSNKGFVESHIDTKKKGKGPLPKRFSLTQTGWVNLKAAVLEALLSVTSTDKRFDLAIASLPVLSPEEAIKALDKRKELLLAVRDNISRKFKLDGGDNLPFHVRALFKHSIIRIDPEISFIDDLIAELTDENGASPTNGIAGSETG